MNKTLITVLKGLLLAVIFGGVCYLFSKDVEMAFWMGMIMFMSMFVKPKQR